MKALHKLLVVSFPTFPHLSPSSLDWILKIPNPSLSRPMLRYITSSNMRWQKHRPTLNQVVLRNETQILKTFKWNRNECLAGDYLSVV